MHILDRWHDEQRHTCWHVEGISATASACQFPPAADTRRAALSSGPWVEFIVTIVFYVGNGNIPRLCLALLGDTPRLSLELAVKGLGTSCPVSPDPCPDGSCSGLRPVFCCLMLGPSLQDTFWRKSWGLASYRNYGLEEEGEAQEKKQVGGVKETVWSWKEKEEGVCCRYGWVLLPGSLSPAPMCTAEQSWWVLVLSVHFSISCCILSNHPAVLNNFLSSSPPVWTLHPNVLHPCLVVSPLLSAFCARFAFVVWDIPAVVDSSC